MTDLANELIRDVPEPWFVKGHHQALARAEEAVRARLEKNGRNPANDNAGIRVGSDLHFMEIFLAEIDRLRGEIAKRETV